MERKSTIIIYYVKKCAEASRTTTLQTKCTHQCDTQYQKALKTEITQVTVGKEPETCPKSFHVRESVLLGKSRGFGSASVRISRRSSEGCVRDNIL